jgi:hypothetical protein
MSASNESLTFAWIIKKFRKRKRVPVFLKPFIVWEHTGSNRGPSACKADALNQLSYAPLFRTAKIGSKNFLQNKFHVYLPL